MPNEPDANTASSQAAPLPREWQPRDHFDLRVAWLVRDTPERAEARAGALAELRGGAVDESVIPVPFPGWDMLYTVAMTTADTLDGALAAARKIIKNSDLRPGPLNLFLADPDRAAPVKPVKGQRLELIARLEKPGDGPANPDDFLRTALVEIDGEHALWAAIEHLELAEEMTTSFESATSPLRSLVGRTCAVGHLNDETGDFEQVELGELRLDGLEVHVGGWSRSFGPGDEVTGVAYEMAAVESAATGETISFEAVPQ